MLNIQCHLHAFLGSFVSLNFKDWASEAPWETPGSWGDAHGDGADPDSHPGGGTDCSGPVEAETLQILPSRSSHEQWRVIKHKVEKHSFIFNLEKKSYFNNCYFVFD